MPQRRSVAWRSSALARPRSTPNTSIVPSRFGTKPMMVRISTDLPWPEPPTKPRTSPRNTSSESWLRMRALPRPTTRSRTRMATPFVAADISSFPDRREEHGEQAVEHDDEKDRFHHRGGGVQAERFRADLEGIERDRLLEAGEKHVRIDAAVAPGDQRAAVDRRHRAQERQDRHGDEQRNDARQDQDFGRIEAHRAQRVDLLAHLHGAELGRIGAARSSGDHDGDNDHADLAQYENADHIDHVDIGAEFAEMEDTLLRQDRPDQERDQQDDGNGPPADPLELMDRGREPERLR